MNWILQHKLIVIGAIIVLFVAVWYGLSSSGGAAPVLETGAVGNTGSPTADSADQQLVATLLSLRAVTLSGTIFTDPAFQSLKDFSTAITPEPIGRPNPFAPLSADAGAGTTTSTVFPGQ